MTLKPENTIASFAHANNSVNNLLPNIGNGGYGGGRGRGCGINRGSGCSGGNGGHVRGYARQSNSYRDKAFLYSLWKIHAYLRKLFEISRKTRKCVCIPGEGGTSK